MFRSLSPEARSKAAFLRWLACTSFILASSFPAWSWGPLGHRVIAKIAEQHLSDKARRRVTFYFGKEASLADVAMWADEIREERPESKPWHYINLSPQATSLKIGRDCPYGDCITVKLREFVGIARLAIRDKEEVRHAVQFIVHLAGDLHQPLHAGHLEDRGGNGIPVKFYGEESNLHSFWDSGIVERIAEDEEHLLERLGRRITPQKKKEWRQGVLRDWTWETHLVAVQVAYGALPPGSPKVLNDEYLRQAREVAEEQLAKAGVRLAELLNRTWP